MPLIPYLEPEQAGPQVRALYEEIGKPANLRKTIANSPDMFAGFMALRRAVNSGAIEPRWRALAFLATSNRVSPTFELDDETWFERSRAAEVHMRRRISYREA